MGGAAGARCTAPVPFVHAAWQRVWLDHFQAGRELPVLTARDGERLIGVAPLLVEGDRAELVGHYSICDYMDIVVDARLRAAVLPLVLAALLGRRRPQIDLRGIRAVVADARGGQPAAAPAAGFSAAREDEALSPSVELPPTWDEYLGRLSKKDRHELRRKLRRLDSRRRRRAARHDGGRQKRRELLDTLFHLMRISSHHKEEFLDRPGMEAFFREMTSVMAAEGMLRFYFLTFDGEPSLRC